VRPFSPFCLLVFFSSLLNQKGGGGGFGFWCWGFFVGGGGGFFGGGGGWVVLVGGWGGKKKHQPPNNPQNKPPPHKNQKTHTPRFVFVARRPSSALGLVLCLTLSTARRGFWIRFCSFDFPHPRARPFNHLGCSPASLVSCFTHYLS